MSNHEGRVDGDLSVYVVTSHGLVPGRTHVDVGRAAVAGGASAVQLRAPDLDPDDRRDAAIRLAQVCAGAGVAFIVNDDPALAVEVGADGVHVGQNDHPDEARTLVGPERRVGVSVDDPDQARRAVAMGADHVAVTVWSTPTKPGAVARGLDGLHAVAQAVDVPVLGIGGIDAGNAASVIAAGAAGVAVVSAVGSALDPVRATRDLGVAVREALATGGSR